MTGCGMLMNELIGVTSGFGEVPDYHSDIIAIRLQSSLH